PTSWPARPPVNHLRSASCAVCAKSACRYDPSIFARMSAQMLRLCIRYWLGHCTLWGNAGSRGSQLDAYRGYRDEIMPGLCSSPGDVTDSFDSRFLCSLDRAWTYIRLTTLVRD